jgi:hypothetical protein
MMMDVRSIGAIRRSPVQGRCAHEPRSRPCPGLARAVSRRVTSLGGAARRCEDAVMERRFLVFVHGAAPGVARARKLIAGMGLAGARVA